MNRGNMSRKKRSGGGSDLTEAQIAKIEREMQEQVRKEEAAKQAKKGQEDRARYEYAMWLLQNEQKKQAGNINTKGGKSAKKATTPTKKTASYSPRTSSPASRAPSDTRPRVPSTRAKASRRRPPCNA